MTTRQTTSFPGTILGYPRIGANRELKKSLESYWKGDISASQLRDQTDALRLENFGRLHNLGLTQPGAIPDAHTLYDQVLDAAFLVGALPRRFRSLSGFDAYFACARGTEEQPALEMTKWFDTNYHYLVPEIDANTPISLSDASIVERYTHARDNGFDVRPVIVGPLTLLALSKGSDDDPDYDPLQRLDEAVDAYGQLLCSLKEAGASWVQLDEPALASDNLTTPRKTLRELAGRAYDRLLAKADSYPQLAVAIAYGNEDGAVSVLANSGVRTIAIDAVRGQLPALEGDGSWHAEDLTIAAGVVDGRNIWRTDLGAAWQKLEELGRSGVRVVASTSTSLQHVPHTLAGEHWEGDLDANLHSWLAFADEKTAEVVVLQRGIDEGVQAIADDIDTCTRALEQRQQAEGVRIPAVRNRLTTLSEADRQRDSSQVRRKAQRERLHLPLFPTTTIGSFPQTSQIRRARAQHNRGQLSTPDYHERLREEISSVIKLQERLGLDVLVHGEAERNDMVQYFAELLDGFDVTANGWVQSYGSRCTRPSILWGDVQRSQSLGGQWTTYAQTLTDKPVKAMLTGPVTIIAWSFPRNDIELSEVADQIALALRDEIAQLEADGTAIIQVDEPALRELLPLDEDRHEQYLNWAVGAFRLATSGVKPETQIHTHLCYSEFNQIIGALAALDADVTSIEAARSRMELLGSVRDAFVNDVGPGVWDIHSPRIPSADELYELLVAALKAIPADKLWVNPDCGLKTRAYPETEATLANLVEAARRLRRDVETGALKPGA